MPAITDMELPRSGPGGKNGPGIFKYFTQKHLEGVLRLDAKKTGEGKGRGKTLQGQEQGHDVEV